MITTEQLSVPTVIYEFVDENGQKHIGRPLTAAQVWACRRGLFRPSHWDLLATELDDPRRVPA